MTPFEKFLEVIFQANLVFPYVGGQLIAFNKKKSKIEIVNIGGGKAGFKIRWIFLSLFLFSIILRLVYLGFVDSNEFVLINKNVDTSLCLTTVLMISVIAERYKSWTYYPEKYVSFLNAIINLKRNQLKGIYKIYKLTRYFFPFKIVNQSENCCKIEGVALPLLSKSKYAYLVLQITGFFCTWIFPYAVPICCIIEKKLPLNAAWWLSWTLNKLNWRCRFTSIIETGFTLSGNYLIWTMAAKQVYCLGADLLVGVLSLTFCQEMAYR